MLGGSVRPSDRREYGLAELEVRGRTEPLFVGTPTRQRVWMSHGDSVTALPDGFEVLARTANTPMAAIADRSGASSAFSFTPRSGTPPHGAGDARELHRPRRGAAGLELGRDPPGERWRGCGDHRTRTG